jgi:predicted house-cleaning noncanonical NTP pyrophosphatase (MazG superfamily)
MPHYNKLVRDRIPEIIRAQGKRLETSVLSEDEYLAQLNAKLREELAEYLESTTPTEQMEELADMLEVIYAIAAAKGVSAEQLDALRRDKAGKRGAFAQRIMLRWVED